MLYRYVASDKNGKLFEGEVDVTSLAEALQFLAGRELRPISVKPMKIERGLFGIFSRISIADKIFLTKYLSLMLKVGTDLLSAINILLEDFEKPSVRNLLLEIRENLTKGLPFHQAFERYPKSFSPVFTNLIKAAESSGNLQETFEHLSASLEKEAQLRNRIRSALIYPAIILTAAFGIFVFLTTFALPKIARVFADIGLKPPFFSRIVFGIGLFFNDHIFIILTLLVAIAIGGYLFAAKTALGRRVWQDVIMRIPVLKRVYRDLAIQRFASGFSSLMRAGLPIVESLHLTANVVGAEEFRRALSRIADEGLSRGLSIGDSFRREPVFPKVISNLVAISEKAGHLDEILETIANFYAESVDSSVKTLVNVLEPLLLLVMGLLVGTIAISIIVPIYQLTSQF